MEIIAAATTYASTPGEDTTWVEHLRSEHLSVGTYCIRAGGTDDQDPHTEDEIYYVVSGSAQFTSAGRTVEVGPGSTLFVAANEVHRFHDVAADLTVLVLFAPAEGSLDA
jgi:mannose-6-phosphate isomerase-like protein (cupin superfamily)